MKTALLAAVAPGALVRPSEAAYVRPVRLPEHNDAGEYFDGEALSYVISAWIFSRAGYGLMYCRQADGRHLEAVLQLRTAGILKLFTRSRHDEYRSLMEIVEGGRRLRPLRFSEDVNIGKKRRLRLTTFDYERGLLRKEKTNYDGQVEVFEVPMAEGVVYEDYLSALYNFRFGAYGPVRPGSVFSFDTVPHQDGTPRHIRIDVLNKADYEGRLRAADDRREKAYFIQIRLPKQVTDSESGLMEGWLSNDFVPTGGAVRDVILWGDVVGELTRQDRLPG